MLNAAPSATRDFLTSLPPMDVAIPIFDKITALDAVGPYEVLSRLPDAQVWFVAAEPGPKRTENGMLALHADARCQS